MTETPPDKESKIATVAECTLKILSIRGLEGLTHSQLSRSSKVSRPWIYKYIGKEKSDLVRFGIHHIGQAFTQLDRPLEFHDYESWVNGKVTRLHHLFNNANNAPYTIRIYFRFRGVKNVIGEAIEHIEEQYVKKEQEEICQVFPTIGPEHALNLAQALVSMRMGLAHRWHLGELGDEKAQTQIRALTHQWFASLKHLT